MQKYTSSATSINRSKLPAVYGRATLSRTTPFVVDYGCGKFTDHIDEHLRRLSKVLYPYDPYNQPDYVNLHTLDFIRWAMDNRIEVDVVCSNVLNVIDSDGEVSRICHDLERIATTTGGTAFVTVYEGNRSGVGRQTGRDQYQRNATLRDYLRFFHNATIKNGMIIIKGGN
jgi:hypothetical protein